MKYCSRCTTPLIEQIPEGDTHLRKVCPSCGSIFYDNPRIIVGTIATWENKILLCKRAIEPALGKWTLPAGFMELGETTEAGAARETSEEAGADVEIEYLHTVYSCKKIGMVYLLYKATINNGRYHAGEESLEVKLVSPEELPWSELAFSSVEFALRAYVSDPDYSGVHQGCLEDESK